MTKKSLFVLLGLAIVLSAILIGVNYSNPSHQLFYSLKRFEEKIALKVARDSVQKMYIYNLLLERRYQELREIASKNDLTLISVASSRYRTTIGEFVKIAIQIG